MDLGLSGKGVLVTGSTRGIGKATARAFLREGARVIVHARSSDTVAPAVSDGYFEEEEPTSLLQRLEGPEEVARVAVFLCSDAAAIIHGSAQRAEGGIIRAVL